MLNLKQVRQAIENRQAFKTNNIEAFYRKEALNNVQRYVIKSYDTEIYNDLTGLDNTKYSHTTSKLQSMIREAFNIPLVKESKNFDVKLNNVKINTSVLV